MSMFLFAADGANNELVSFSVLDRDDRPSPINKKSKRGMTTAKQRLGKILGMHRLVR